MRTLELADYGVMLLNEDEYVFIEGGNKYKRAWEFVKKAAEYIGIADMVLDAVEGFNEGASKSCCK